MPALPPITLSGSVGSGGTNRSNDVKTVQSRLNALMSAPRVALAVDGLVGPKTIGMIRDFQKSVCAFQYGDGRVDPGKQTLAALNNAASKSIWSGSSGPAPSPSPTPTPTPGDASLEDFPEEAIAPLSGAERDTIRELVAIAESSVRYAQAKRLLIDLAHQYHPAFRALAGLKRIGRASLELVEGLANLAQAGVKAADFVLAMASSVAGKAVRGEYLLQIIRTLRDIPVVQAAREAVQGHLSNIFTVVGVAVQAVFDFGVGNASRVFEFLYKTIARLGMRWLATVRAVKSIMQKIAIQFVGPYINAAFEVMQNMIPKGVGSAFSEFAHRHVIELIKKIASGQVQMQVVNRILAIIRASVATSWIGTASDFAEWVADMLDADLVPDLSS